MHNSVTEYPETLKFMHKYPAFALLKLNMGEKHCTFH